MIDRLVQWAWGFILGPIQAYYKVTVSDDLALLVIALVALHVALAVATVVMDGKSVCTILAPLRKVFELPEGIALLVASLTFTINLFRAIPYAIAIYIRAWFFGMILTFYVLLSASVGMFVAILILLPFTLMPNPPTVDPGIPILAGWALCFWKFFGRTLGRNIREAFRCLGHEGR